MLIKVQVMIIKLSLNCCHFFQRTVFGEVGQIGHLAQSLAGVGSILDHVPRLGLNEMVEIVQDPEVTANIAIEYLVQVSKLLHLLFFKGSLC